MNIREDRDKRKREYGPRLNHQIRVSECRLIGDDGTQYGLVSIAEARRISEDTGLDLVEVSATSKPPVVKLIDYGKFKYETQKKASENKKRQVVSQLKEVQFRPNIEAHDLETKLKKADKFLHQGDRIKLVMQFRGREMAYKEQGMEKFVLIVNQVVEFGGILEAESKLVGNRIIAIVAPNKKILKIVADQTKERAKSKTEEKKDKVDSIH